MVARMLEEEARLQEQEIQRKQSSECDKVLCRRFALV